MGRKGNWLSAMKKAFNHESKENITQDGSKPKKKWFRKKKRSAEPISTTMETIPTVTTTTTTTTSTNTTLEAPRTDLPPPVVIDNNYATSLEAPNKIEEVEVKAAEEINTNNNNDNDNNNNNEQTKHAYNVAVATTKAAEAAVAAAQAAAEVVRLTATSNKYAPKSNQELAAIKIQTRFRGYMARRTLRAIRGLMRLKTVMQGQTVKRQTTNTLKSMQTLARMQSQIRERRLKMAEENHARQKQLQQKSVKEQAINKDVEKSQQNDGNWDSSGKSKEQIQAKLHSKHDAAIRRERTLAYAYNHQQPWKATSRSGHTLFMDSNNPHWGWSWLERWLAARPWEIATIPDKELFSNENSPRVKLPKKTTNTTTALGSSETVKYYARNHNVEKPSPSKQPRSSSAGRLSTSSNAPPKMARKLISQSPKVSPRATRRTSIWGRDDDDAKSMLSMQSEQSRQSSVGEDNASSIRDDESQGSSQTVPSYMAPTQSARAKSRFGNEVKGRNKSVTPDRLSVGSARKMGSYSPSPVRSRHSNSSITDANPVSDHTN